MDSYSIGLTRSAERDLRKISKSHIPVLVRRIRALGQNPRPSGLILLRGQNRYYRIRQGDYRIVYEVNDTGHLVTVIKIGHRREVYTDR